jgi:hypoxanthine phosphoribosyltransferase
LKTLLGNHVKADLDKVLFDREQIAARIVALAKEISRDLDELPDDGEVVLVSILTGSVIFVADLIRQLPQKLRIELVTVKSYPGRSTESQGAKLIDGIDGSIEGKHVLIVDDILDSGGTLNLIREDLSKRNPASLRSCVLLRKKRPSAMATPCEYVGFDIPDVFVVGYGLDFDNYYRNLPVIGTLREEAM